MLEVVVKNSSSPSGSALKPSVSRHVVSEVDIVDEAGRNRGKLKTIKTVVVKKRLLPSTSKEQRVSTSTDGVTITSHSTNTATVNSGATAATVTSNVAAESISNFSSNSFETSESVTGLVVTEDVVQPVATAAEGVTNVANFSGESSETSKSVTVTENAVQQSISQESAAPSDSCPSIETFEDSLENVNVTKDATESVQSSENTNVTKDATESVQCLVRDKQGNITTFEGGPNEIPADYTLVQVIKVIRTKVVQTSSTVIHGSRTGPTVITSSSQSTAPSTSAAITDSLSPKFDDALDTSASISLSMDSFANSVEDLSSVSSNMALFEGASTHSLFSNRSPSRMSKTHVDAYIHQCRGMCLLPFFNYF
ncbi:hypothetical protein V9T40_008919 [Parthenolecanium corni]|uniref:Uncharacterized protein n=1 Tax=Parthenolecanium corni TaxID=536013 RepID=A0AAN9U0F8_9HEMI